MNLGWHAYDFVLHSQNSLNLDQDSTKQFGSTNIVDHVICHLIKYMSLEGNSYLESPHNFVIEVISVSLGPNLEYFITVFSLNSLSFHSVPLLRSLSLKKFFVSCLSVLRMWLFHASNTHLQILRL